MKRARNHLVHLSKAKFMLAEKEGESETRTSQLNFDLSGPNQIRQLFSALEVLSSSQWPLGVRGNFSALDLVQILKEMDAVYHFEYKDHRSFEEPKKFTLRHDAVWRFLLFMLTRNYSVSESPETGEVNEELLIKLLDLSCSLLDKLTSLCIGMAEAVLSNFDLTAVLSKVIENYFLKSDSPLKIAELVSEGDLDRLKPRLDLLFSIMHFANNIMEHDKEARSNMIHCQDPRFRWRVNQQETPEFEIGSGLANTFMHLVQVYEDFDQEIRSKCGANKRLLDLPFW